MSRLIHAEEVPDGISNDPPRIEQEPIELTVEQRLARVEYRVKLLMQQDQYQVKQNPISPPPSTKKKFKLRWIIFAVVGLYVAINLYQILFLGYRIGG